MAEFVKQGEGATVRPVLPVHDDGRKAVFGDGEASHLCERDAMVSAAQRENQHASVFDGVAPGAERLGRVSPPALLVDRHAEPLAELLSDAFGVVGNARANPELFGFLAQTLGDVDRHGAAFVGGADFICELWAVGPRSRKREPAEIAQGHEIGRGLREKEDAQGALIDAGELFQLRNARVSPSRLPAFQLFNRHASGPRRFLQGEGGGLTRPNQQFGLNQGYLTFGHEQRVTQALGED
jgi:hypothetical protein